MRNFKLTEEEIIEILVAAQGHAEVLGLINGPRRWVFETRSLGRVKVSAAYHGKVLQARFRREDAGAMPASKPGSKPKAAPFDHPPAAGGPGFSEPTGQLEMPPLPPPPLAAPAPASPPLYLESEPLGETPLAIDPPLFGPEPVEAPAPGASIPRPAPVQSTPFGSAAPDLATGAAPDSAASAPSELSALLKLARERGASDLHVVAGRPAKLRIAGELNSVGDALPGEAVDRMLTAALPDRMRSTLREHGSADFAYVHPELGRFRANISRQRTGLKLTARLIGNGIRSLEQLGLPPAIATATEHHQGLIVITGPTGHGKTTTLAALVDIINRNRPDHVITVEDPIEYVHGRGRAMISQREVGTHTKTFRAALKGSLREDPDVIVVGELRDTETVRMALSASETGHLVITTMNTPNAAKTIERLIDLFPPGDQPQVRTTLAGGLRLVVSQRLVPTADQKRVCAAAELLPGTPQLWALIRDNKTFQIPSLQQRGKSLGIVRLDESLADLVRAGATSLEIAQQFAEAPEQLRALSAGTGGAPSGGGESSWETPGSAQQLGKDMFAKAGKFFGNDKK